VSLSRAASLVEFLDACRRQVDEALERSLPKPPACPPVLSDAMRYSLFAGGKRLRPALVMAAADAVAPADPDASLAALPAACAVEMLHTYSLIHDDLPAMDNDSLRRGRPTLHVVYGDGIAILAGDGLQAEAFALMAREPQTTDATVAARKLRAIAVVGSAAGAVGMVGGQAVDLQAAGQVLQRPLSVDRDGLRAMHLRKTGAMIVACAESGAIMAGGSETQVAGIRRFATEVGLAFQIVDDILDVEGEDAALGKTAGKDAARDKPTYPALFGLDRSRTMAAECLARSHAALADAGLAATWLAGIAEWVVGRKN
jgi:geranylgeranyl diphosphate synthase, type II